MKLPFQIDLQDKVAVVTGGGGVICGVMAEALSACGAKVAILDHKQENADALAEKIKESGGEAMGVCANVLEKESLFAARDVVRRAYGKTDILINGAGGNHPKGTTTEEYYQPGDEEKRDFISFFDLDAEGVSFVFNLNFLGTLLPTQIFAADMVGKEDGAIINISSMNAFSPLTKIPAYSGAKAAVSNFTRWLAVHFSKVGIRVNAVAPGFFVTKQNRALLFNPEGTPTARTKKILSQTPMERFGEPEELIGTMLWLVSKEASGFVSGIVVPVDGGFSAYSGV